MQHFCVSHVSGKYYVLSWFPVCSYSSSFKVDQLQQNFCNLLFDLFPNTAFQYKSKTKCLSLSVSGCYELMGNNVSRPSLKPQMITRPVSLIMTLIKIITLGNDVSEWLTL